MITGVNFDGYVPGGSEAGLSRAQDESLMALLSNYDAKNLSSEDARDIVLGIREIGIKADNGLASALISGGFNARDIAEKSGVSRSQVPLVERVPTVLQPLVNQDDEPFNREALTALTALTELIGQYDGAELSEDDWSELYLQLHDARIDASKPLLDLLL